MQPASHRGPILPRMPIMPRASGVAPLQFSDEMIAQIAAVWQDDLIGLRLELHRLRPWYLKLWDWWHDTAQ